MVMFHSYVSLPDQWEFQDPKMEVLYQKYIEGIYPLTEPFHIPCKC